MVYLLETVISMAMLNNQMVMDIIQIIMEYNLGIL
jgi:hypothetical protein